MKGFVVVLLATIAFAQANYDWSKIEPMHLYANSVVELGAPQNRIVGGEEVVPHSRPFQAALFADIGRIAFCGGSLISPRHVLTAAHCVQPAKSIEVLLGAHKVNEQEDGTVRLNSTDFYVHPNWSMLTLKNDIAIITLPEEVQLTENIQLVKLPTSETYDEDQDATVSGWGKDTDQATAVSPVLRKITVPLLPNSRCKWYYMGVIQDTHMCTNSKGGRSTCSGDSGGPLTLEEDGTQVGIVSFGIAFGCELGWPAAYTRVPKYIDWINSIIGA